MLHRIRSIFILLALVAFSSGCLKMEHYLTFKEDGEATYRLKYSISEQAIVQFRAMEKLKNQLAEASGEPPPGIEMEPLFHLFLDPDEATLRAAIVKYESLGIVLKELDVKVVSAWRNVELKLDITDLNKLSESEIFKAHGFNLTQDKDGNYVFNREPHINRPGEIVSVPTEEELRQLIPVVSGFNTTVRIKVPGNIKSTTAFDNSRNRASWIFDFDRDTGAIQALQHQAFLVKFSAPETRFPEIKYNGSQITN